MNGTDRRGNTADSLQGATQVVAAPRSAPSLAIKAGQVADVENSLTSKIGRSLGKWATESLQVTANKEHEKAVLDGQMAYQQGKAIDDVDMAGNKWALSGYRLMQAQTISSSMLASQQELISQKGYQDNPDTFRDQYVNQLEQQITGLDENTARMVRETMSKQMPTLVAQHTQAHLNYQEGEAFKALSHSIDTVSKDATATDALLAAASGGPGSVSSGLSDDRRRKAVSEGVVRAFQNGNPKAYSVLKQSGVLEDFSTTDKQAIESAQNRYQSELRTSYNEKFIQEKNTLLQDISTGEYSGKQSMEAFAKLYADHGINITATEGNAAYVAAEDAVAYELEGDAYLLKQAKAIGDDKAAAYLEDKIARQGGPRPATAQSRAVAIKEALTELEKQSDLAASEEMRISQMDIDAKLENQVISPKEYFELSNQNRKAYGVKQSAAITRHLVSTVEATHKANKSKVDANKREALDANFEALKAKFHSDISKEGILPEEAGRISSAYQNKVTELYAANGVSLASMNFSGITADVASKYYTAESKGLEYAAEQRIIEQSAKTGTLSELSETKQRKFWQDKTATLAKDITGEIERGAIQEQEAPQVLEQSLLGAYVQAGSVDPQVRAESIAVIGAETLVNSKGEVNPNVVQTVQAYAKLTQADPRVASTMLDEKTKLRADQIIEAAGGANGNILDGVQRYHDAQQKVGGFEANRPEITEATIKRTRKAVKSYIGRNDIGVVQAIFTDATLDQVFDRSDREEDILRSSETKDLLEKLVIAETTRMAFLDPGADPKYMVKGAMEAVAQRTDFIGDTPVVMNQGKGIKEQLFGSRLRDLDKPDLANEVIVDHLAKLADQPGFEFIKSVTTGERGGVLSKVGIGLANTIPLVDVEQPIFGTSDTVTTNVRGVRPFTILSDGDNVAVRVRMSTGALSEPIALDLPQIGEDYFTEYKRNLSKRAWE